MSLFKFKQIHSVRWIPLIYVILLGLNSCWFFSGNLPSENESPFRILIGGFFIFFVPGLIWGDVLEFRSRHMLETLALAFALTLTIEGFLLLIPFCLGLTINVWVIVLLLFTAIGIVLQLKERTKELQLATPLFSIFKQPLQRYNVRTTLIGILLLGLCYGTYRWGEDLSDILGEKLLQAVFVRYYYSLPLVLRDLGITPGAPPTNLIQFWEYLLAGWATLINLDPLPLFFRARCIIPILGLAGMYLLIKNIFLNRKKSEVIFWGCLMMSLGRLMLLSPSKFDWVKQDFSRGLTAFMGTVHHSDAAMDALLPVWIALSLMAFRRPVWRNFLLLTGVSVAGFMWHPREFFQVVLYVGIVGIICVFYSTPHKKIVLKRWILLFLLFCIVAGGFAFIASRVYSKTAQGYDEFKVKQRALSLAVRPEHLAGIRNLFNFPFHLILSSALAPDTFFSQDQIVREFQQDWQDALWLVLSACAVPILIGWGEVHDKFLALFYCILWFLALCWNFSMLLLIVLTYSEVHMSTPRILYLFAYLLIADGLYVLSQRLSKRIKNLHASVFVAGIVALGLGGGVQLWWISGKPHFFMLSIALSLAVWLSGWQALFPKMPVPILSLLSIGLVGYWWWTTSQRHVWLTLSILGCLIFMSLLLAVYPGIQQKIRILLFPTHDSRSKKYSQAFVYITALTSIFCFCLPILGTEQIRMISHVLTVSRPAARWFGSDNYLGFSNELISFLREMPPKQNFLVYPLGRGLVSLYAPQYVAIFPSGICSTAINAMADLNQIKAGQHPLYPPPNLRKFDSTAINHAAVTTWLNLRKIDYIFIQKDYYANLLPYFERFPDDYEIVFHSPGHQEVIIRYRRKDRVVS